jgi:hypothetical protein
LQLINLVRENGTRERGGAGDRSGDLQFCRAGISPPVAMLALLRLLFQL